MGRNGGKTKKRNSKYFKFMQSTYHKGIKAVKIR